MFKNGDDSWAGEGASQFVIEQVSPASNGPESDGRATDSGRRLARPFAKGEHATSLDCQLGFVNADAVLVHTSNHYVPEECRTKQSEKSDAANGLMSQEAKNPKYDQEANMISPCQHSNSFYAHAIDSSSKQDSDLASVSTISEDAEDRDGMNQYLDWLRLRLHRPVTDDEMDVVRPMVGSPDDEACKRIALRLRAFFLKDAEDFVSQTKHIHANEDRVVAAEGDDGSVQNGRDVSG